MALQVIGAGLGRTGTLSLKAALEQLGFSRCYHMYEVLGNLAHAPTWTAASRGEPVDYDEVFDGFRATVDWPACVFWNELAEAYPDAKVVLSVRPPERWYASFHDTIYQVVTRGAPDDSLDLPPEFVAVREMAECVVDRATFGDLKALDRDGILAAYEAHNQSVRDGVPPERLLEFDVAEGWEPLCAFLEVPVPAGEFPNINDRATFRQLFGLDGDASMNADPNEVEERFRNAL